VGARIAGIVTPATRDCATTIQKNGRSRQRAAKV
jgi:hypothetical protein